MKKTIKSTFLIALAAGCMVQPKKASGVTKNQITNLLLGGAIVGGFIYTAYNVYQENKKPENIAFDKIIQLINEMRCNNTFLNINEKTTIVLAEDGSLVEENAVYDQYAKQVQDILDRLKPEERFAVLQKNDSYVSKNIPPACDKYGIEVNFFVFKNLLENSIHTRYDDQLRYCLTGDRLLEYYLIKATEFAYSKETDLQQILAHDNNALYNYLESKNSEFTDNKSVTDRIKKAKKLLQSLAAIHINKNNTQK